MDTDFRGEPGLLRRNRALDVTLPLPLVTGFRAGIELLKSSIDMEFCLDKGVAHLEPMPELPRPILDRGLLSQEES